MVERSAHKWAQNAKVGGCALRVCVWVGDWGSLSPGAGGGGVASLPGTAPSALCPTLHLLLTVLMHRCCCCSLWLLTAAAGQRVGGEVGREVLVQRAGREVCGQVGPRGRRRVAREVGRELRRRGWVGVRAGGWAAMGALERASSGYRLELLSCPSAPSCCRRLPVCRRVRQVHGQVGGAGALWRRAGAVGRQVGGKLQGWARQQAGMTGSCCCCCRRCCCSCRFSVASYRACGTSPSSDVCLLLLAAAA